MLKESEEEALADALDSDNESDPAEMAPVRSRKVGCFPIGPVTIHNSEVGFISWVHKLVSEIAFLFGGVCWGHP